MLIKNKYGECDYSFEKDYVHIFNLFIYEKYRRNGKAAELLKKVIKKIKNTGYDGEIQIVADSKVDGMDKKKLKSFYGKLGLKVFDYYG
jgi:GNAT superfamily N-acetyltransferase